MSAKAKIAQRPTPRGSRWCRGATAGGRRRATMRFDKSPRPAAPRLLFSPARAGKRSSPSNSPECFLMVSRRDRAACLLPHSSCVPPVAAAPSRRLLFFRRRTPGAEEAARPSPGTARREKNRDFSRGISATTRLAAGISARDRWAG